MVRYFKAKSYETIDHYQLCIMSRVDTDPTKPCVSCCAINSELCIAHLEWSSKWKAFNNIKHRSTNCGDTLDSDFKQTNPLYQYITMSCMKHFFSPHKHFFSGWTFFQDMKLYSFISDNCRKTANNHKFYVIIWLEDVTNKLSTKN